MQAGIHPGRATRRSTDCLYAMLVVSIVPAQAEPIVAISFMYAPVAGATRHPHPLTTTANGYGQAAWMPAFAGMAAK